jgi:cytochrome c
MNAVRLLALFVLVLAGCGRNRVIGAVENTFAAHGDDAHRTTYAVGDAERGATLIEEKGCGACHTIPGVRRARGVVAPPLDRFALRSFIAGEVANTPDNLIRWLKEPRAIAPKTAMPAVGLTDDEARDVAAFLYELD